MLSWTRHHWWDGEWHRRYDGFAGTTTPPEDCCILLETGAPDEILLEDGSGCIAPEDC